MSYVSVLAGVFPVVLTLDHKFPQHYLPPSFRATDSVVSVFLEKIKPYLGRATCSKELYGKPVCQYYWHIKYADRFVCDLIINYL